MRTAIGWIGIFAGLCLLGLPLMSAPTFRLLPLVSRVAVAWGVGAYILATVMTLFALAGIPWHPATLIIVSLVVAFLLRRWTGRREPLAAASERGRSLWLWPGLAAAGGGVFAAFIAAVTSSATSADLFLFWGPKGESFAAARTIDTRFLTERFHDYLHASYPPLVPDLYAFATELAGRFSWTAATLTYPVVLAALALALIGLLRLSLPTADAAVMTAVVSCGIALAGNVTDIAGNGEIFLLFFEATAMALLIAPQAAAPPCQLLAGLMLGGAAASKVEGLVFVLAAGAAFLVRGPKSDSLGRTAIRLAAPTLVVIGGWFAFGASRRLFVGYEGYGETFTLYPSALARVLGGIVSSLFDVGYALPYLVPLVLLATRRTPWRPAFVPLATAAVLSIFFVFTYLHLPDAGQWIEWSAARIFTAWIPLLTLAAVARPYEEADAMGPETLHSPR